MGKTAIRYCRDCAKAMMHPLKPQSRLICADTGAVLSSMKRACKHYEAIDGKDSKAKS